jgi:hypothetical protein
MKRDCFFKGLALVAVAVTLSFAQKPDTRWYTANPTAKAFIIATANELAGLAVIVNGMWDGTPTRDNFSGKTITLSGNIDLSQYKNWDPIGDYSVNKSNVFSGKFDGGGYTISNLTIDRPSKDYQGLFGYISGGAVGNFGVDKMIVSGHTNVGGVAGTLANGGAVGKCNTNGSVSGIGNGAAVGGVVGQVINKSRVFNSYSGAAVGGTGFNMGGVAGYVGAGSEESGSSGMSTCYFTGSVSGGDYVGGVVGTVDYNGTVEFCYSSGTVNGTGNRIGGVAGSVSGGTVRWSYSTGMVSGKDEVGGVAGRVDRNNGVVKSCYSTGTVKGRYSVGGVTGIIDNVGCGVYYSYSLGAVSGEKNVGGVVGLRKGVVDMLQTTSRYGIVLETSVVLGCAALNPSVNGVGDGVGRVVGLSASRSRYSSRDTGLSNNAAYSEMTNNNGDTKWTDRGAAARDGEGISAAAVNADGTIGGRFTGKSGWLTENGKLPGTGFYSVRDDKNIFADWVKTVTIPPHLYADAAEMEAEVERQKGVELVKAEAERKKQVNALQARLEELTKLEQYQAVVNDKIQNNWNRVISNQKLSKKDRDRTVDIKFAIRSRYGSGDSRGDLVNSSISIMTSSGDSRFDQIAAEVVRNSGPFQSLPREAGRCRNHGIDWICEQYFSVRLGPINK